MGMPLYNLLYVAAIIFFTYFYVSIIFNPTDVADNLRKYGGFIPGIRPGKNTSDAIDTTSCPGSPWSAPSTWPCSPSCRIPDDRLQGPVPALHRQLPGRESCPSGVTQGLNVDFYFGGTSILIVVGVAMDTLQQIEAQLVMRHYDGFMRRGRIRGRRG